jgi:hypothetical protein
VGVWMTKNQLTLSETEHTLLRVSTFEEKEQEGKYDYEKEIRKQDCSLCCLHSCTVQNSITLPKEELRSERFKENRKTFLT